VTRRLAATVALAAGLVVTAAIPAAAAPRRIDVHEGRGALGDALGRARPGDVIRVHRGRYREAVTITKRVTVKAVGPGRVVVDGRCRTGIVIDVEADGVTLRGFTVRGADEGFGAVPIEVDLSAVSGAVARRMVFRDTCEAEYGINVFGTGSVVVGRSVAHGFSDAGIYVGGIATGPVTVVRTHAYGSVRGIIVEDSAPGTVTVLGNRVDGNGTGIFLHGSDSVLLQGNTVAANQEYGIHVDATSDANSLFENLVSGSGVFDVLDEGAGNCWNGTTYGTASPDPPPTC
jgi:parallel beta-helix repeat protein